MKLNRDFRGYFDAKELNSMLYWVFDAGFSEETVRELEKKYNEPHRFYHGKFHLNYLWKLFEKNQKDLNERDKIVIGLAIAFHDSIYEIGSNNNEEQSANFFENCVTKDGVGFSDSSIMKDVISCIIFSNPKKYNELDSDPHKEIWFKFVTEYDLYHFLDNDYDFDLSNYLIFKEYQKYDYNLYSQETKKLIEGIPFFNAELLQKPLRFFNNPKKMSFGVYAGTFNPFHVGHASILKMAENVFDKVIILVGTNPSKDFYPAEERAQLVKKVLPYHQVDSWTGLTTDYIDELEKKLGVNVTLIRGIRSDTDFAIEEQNQRWMEEMKPNLNVIYLPCESKYKHVSSSGLRYLESFGNNSKRNESLYEQKYKVNTEQHYSITKQIIQKKFKEVF